MIKLDRRRIAGAASRSRGTALVGVLAAAAALVALTAGGGAGLAADLAPSAAKPTAASPGEGTLGKLGLAATKPAAAPAAKPKKNAKIPAAPKKPDAPLGANVSGLAWRSGGSCLDPEFAAWRKRRLDSVVTFTWPKTWDTMLWKLGDVSFKALVSATPQPVVTLPMMPKSEFKQHAKCAKGAFDGYFRQFGSLLVQQGAGHAIVRIGHEANIGSKSHPWGIDKESEVKDYVACFRRTAQALKSTAPNVRIEWTNAKKTNLPFSPMKMYPGDDVVQVLGLHYYNTDGQFRTPALWDAYFNSTYAGGPQGMNSWLKEAAARGKLLGVPEWGLWQKTTSTKVADDPLYMRNMHGVFKANAKRIAYENYFNCKTVHQIHPTTTFPKGSAEYRKLWSGG